MPQSGLLLYSVVPSTRKKSELAMNCCGPTIHDLKTRVVLLPPHEPKISDKLNILLITVTGILNVLTKLSIILKCFLQSSSN